MNRSYRESLVPRGTDVPRPEIEPRYGPGRPPPPPPSDPQWPGGPGGPGGGGRGPRRGFIIAISVLAGVAVLATGAGLGWGASQFVPGVLQGRFGPGHPAAGGSGGAVDVQAVANKVDPAIVDINTEIGAGTGMLVTSSGEILTNNHVIEGAANVQVSVEGHAGKLKAKVLGEDPTQDVALVKIQGSGYPTVSLAGQSAAKVGQQVVAIGNARGQGGTPEATQGAITGLDKSITARDPTGAAEQLTGLIQTNAPIVEGDSGGALADGSGKVLGMITAGGTEGPRSSASSRESTVGFAIPASTANGVVKQIESGKPSSSVIIGLPGYLGVQVQTLSPSAASRLGLNVNSGALVARVVDGSPAAAVGITESSVITAVNGATVESADALGQALRAFKPGQQVNVSWVDETGSHSGTATLGSGPAG